MILLLGRHWAIRPDTGPLTLTVRSSTTMLSKGVLKSVLSLRRPSASRDTMLGRGRLYPKVNSVCQPPNRGKRGFSSTKAVRTPYLEAEAAQQWSGFHQSCVGSQ